MAAVTDKKFTSSIPDLWGGIECSYNRVGDRFMDQLLDCGHYERGEEDIVRFASLGFKAMRYPVIWEKHQPALGAKTDWSWTENQLHALRSFHIEPIAGLMHHGNGPAFTSLLDATFPYRFQKYAGHVAEQFPWLRYYTPINEPLTTARFSTLYGLWYPHKREAGAFASVFFNQMKAIVLAMRSIREVNPDALLIQTEDLGKTYSTPLLRYQADFENHRRWLTWDVLCGFLDQDHPLWDYFKWIGISDHLLDFFRENPCRPDIIGADHYLTSERFLDENVQYYPAHSHGGNEKHCYADVEAIRVKHDEPWGLKPLLKECWERYHIPIAITEVHINGDSDDRIRWFQEVWDNAVQLKKEGIEIPAVTAWAVLGSYGWNDLLTTPHGHYEAGAFDLRSGIPQPTPFAHYLKDLSVNPETVYTVLLEKGWWQKETRCLYNTDPLCRDIDIRAHG